MHTRYQKRSVQIIPALQSSLPHLSQFHILYGSQNMMSLNEDVIFEILLRLPVKTLLQFRCVCKAWYALIKSSLFTYKHLAFQRAYGAGDDERIIVKYFKDAENKDVLTLYNDYESLSLLNAPPEIEIQGSRWPFDLVCEANGIFCLSNKYDISLMNPVLREFRKIPAFYGRAFSAHPVGIGFAFDESTNDYKILRIDHVIYDDQPRHYNDKVGALYSLSSNSWKELGRIPMLDSYHLNPDSYYVFVNGSIHVMGRLDGIFAFNITTELFQEVQAPRQLQPLENGSSAPPPVLFVLENLFLALVSFSEVSSGLLLSVWAMKEYGVADSWIQEYCIQTLPIIRRPLSFWKKDKLLFASKEGELTCIDLPTGQLHQLQQFRRYGFNLFGVKVFNESLISISEISNEFFQVYDGIYGLEEIEESFISRVAFIVFLIGFWWAMCNF